MLKAVPPSVFDGSAPPPPLRSHAEMLLREALLRGQLKPGERVNEVALAGAIGISRGTLREALRSLEQDGLVVAAPRRGVFVRSLTAQEALDISEVRLSLEVTAARRVCATLDDLKRRALEAAYSQLIKVEEEPFDIRLRSDFAFHEAICVASGNHALVGVWRALIGTVTIMLLSIGPGEATQLLDPRSHLPLLEAIEAGREEQIASIWRKHYESGLRHIVEHLPSGNTTGVRLDGE
jgi:DNA-binding GntR family transcriptional regulator